MWSRPGFREHFRPQNTRAPGSQEFLAKAGLNMQVSPDFEIKLNAAYSDLDTQGTSQAQRYFCPAGAPGGPFGVPGTECKLDDETSHGDLSPALSQIDSRFPADGVPFTTIEQSLISAEMSWRLGDYLTVSSVTGLYDLELFAADHVTFSPIAFINFAGGVEKQTFLRNFACPAIAAAVLTGWWGFSIRMILLTMRRQP